MRILLATEELTVQPSEGLLVFVMHLCRYLSRHGDLTAVYASGNPESTLRSLRLLSPRVLVSPGLVRHLREERYDTVIYIPSSGLTGFGLWRSLVIRSLSKSPTITIALQERRVGTLHTLISQFGCPDIVLTPVNGLIAKLDKLGINVDFIMPGYDDRIFKAVSKEVKMQLRKKYNLPPDRYLVLHVGHIRESRNMQIFLQYRRWGADILPVIKAGEVDPSWRDRLRNAGVIVIDEYIEHMNELYQVADCYLFPVHCRTGALEFPLSVIEASACNLPVLTTRFGALPDVIGETDGFRYFSAATEVPGLLAALRMVPAETRELVKDFTWEMVFSRYLMPQMQQLAVIRERS
ncbi:MAG: glycosyltransferase family 4 protein [bacterium]|nr:MAG: glycosyltransferase family 4 protein [bacterium]